jgi:hypothetical protein
MVWNRKQGAGTKRQTVGIVRDWKDGTLLLHQEDLVKTLLSKFILEERKGSDAPLEERL